MLLPEIDLSSRHWWIILAVLLLAAAAGLGVPIALKISSAASFEERLEFASRLLEEVPLVDGHNDLPWNIRKFLHNRLRDFDFRSDLRNVTPWSNSLWSHTDLRRLEQGHVAAQVSAFLFFFRALRRRHRVCEFRFSTYMRITDKEN